MINSRNPPTCADPNKMNVVLPQSKGALAPEKAKSPHTHLENDSAAIPSNELALLLTARAEAASYTEQLPTQRSVIVKLYTGTMVASTPIYFWSCN